MIESADRPSELEARDLAVRALYEADVRGDGGMPPGSVDHLPARAHRLAAGVIEHRSELDAAIEAASEHWRVDRMPVVDRAILRLGLYELRYEPGVPTGVVVSEAVRIAKAYSTERSGAFVNGVLGALARRERPEG